MHVELQEARSSENEQEQGTDTGSVAGAGGCWELGASSGSVPLTQSLFLLMLLLFLLLVLLFLLLLLVFLFLLMVGSRNVHEVTACAGEAMLCVATLSQLGGVLACGVDDWRDSGIFNLRYFCANECSGDLQ